MKKLQLSKIQVQTAIDFIASDIAREIQLAKATEKDPQALKRLGINLGGGNYLAALGLLCYTEFGGNLLYGKDTYTTNFDKFFARLGPEYRKFKNEHEKVYGIFRCGLAHGYFISYPAVIEMTYKNDGRPGIGVYPDSGKYYFVVEKYYHDLLKAFRSLKSVLYGYESVAMRRPRRKRSR